MLKITVLYILKSPAINPHKCLFAFFHIMHVSSFSCIENRRSQHQCIYSTCQVYNTWSIQFKNCYTCTTTDNKPAKQSYKFFVVLFVFRLKLYWYFVKKFAMVGFFFSPVTVIYLKYSKFVFFPFVFSFVIFPTLICDLIYL